MKTIKFKLVKKVILSLLLGVTFSGFSQIGIGTPSPTSQSSLDIRATDKGLLIPRLTTAQRTTLGTSLTTAADSNNKGMQVFDTETSTNWFWNGTAWVEVIDASSTLRKRASNLENTSLQPYQLVYIDPATFAVNSKYGALNLTSVLTYAIASLGPIIGYVDSATAIAPQQEFYVQTLSSGQSLLGISGTFIQGEQIWYRPFLSPQWSTTRDNQNPCFFLGYSKSSSGSASGRTVSVDPKWYNTSNSNVLVNYKTVAGAYPTTPSKGEIVYTTSTGAAGGTIYRIETYDGSSWALDKGVYPYIATLNYPAEVIVTNNDKLYQSNGIIPANTTFTIGTSLATWKQIADNAVPNWTDGGALTIGATTTAPTKPTTRVADKVYYKQIGPKTWQVQLIYSYNSNSGSSNGSGDYLLTLPNNLTFDQSILTQEYYTSNVTAAALFSKVLPGSSFNMYRSDGYSLYQGGIIPYNASQYRVLLATSNATSQCWSSSWYANNSNSFFELRINFTFQSAN